MVKSQRHAGVSPARGRVYDRTIVVPQRQSVHVPKISTTVAAIPTKPLKSIPASSTGAYFDVKPTQARKHHQHPTSQPDHHPTQPTVERPASEPAIPVSPIAQTVELAAPVAPRGRTRGSTGLFKRYGLYGMAVAVFVIGMYAAIDGILTNQTVESTASVLSERTTDGSSNRPSEKKPAATSGYKVSADLPRIISIPSQDVEARILHLGVDENNTLLAPLNIYDAGWYTASAKQTDPAGAMLIDGHVSGPTKHGVFYNLKKMKQGDEITIERGDGLKTVFVVQVVKTSKVSEVDMQALLQSVEPGKLGLNLITCGGSFDARTNEFDSRVQVFAVKKQ